MSRIAGKQVGTIDVLRDYYDKRYRESPTDDEERHYARLLRLANPKPGAELLDVGCGQGMLLKLADRMGLGVSGVELSQVAGDKAHQLCLCANIWVGNAEELPWPDATFDYVFNLGSQSHFR